MSIYKYVIAERIDVLKNGRIRFCQAGALNDPIEMRPFFEAMAEDSYLRSELEKVQAEMWESALKYTYNNSPEYHSFSFDEFKTLAEQQQSPSQMLGPYVEEAFQRMKDDDSRGDSRRDVYKMVDENMGVLSLTEKPDNLLMWAHYAQQHQGLVIEFDETHPYFAEKRPNVEHLQKVKYSVDRPRGDSFFDLTFEDMLLTKSKDWEYEQEWRMARALEDSDETIPNPTGDIHLFSVPPECIKGIILGARMLDKDKADVLNLIKNDARYKHVNIHQASVDEMRFQLNIEPI